MTSSTHKRCAKCGAEFKRSRADRTVNCPSCRRRPTAGTSRADEFYVKMGEARQRGHAAQDAGDTEAYERALADFRFWADRRAEEIRRVAS